MAISPYDASNAIITCLNTAWQLGAQAAAGSATIPELVVAAVDRSGLGSIDRPDTNPWGRIGVKHNDAPARSMGGGPGRRMVVERNGIAWVECRLSFDDGTALPKAIALAQIALTAYEGTTITTGAIWFPRVVLREYGNENGRWQRCDVLAYFRYLVEIQTRVSP